MKRKNLFIIAILAASLTACGNGNTSEPALSVIEEGGVSEGRADAASVSGNEGDSVSEALAEEAADIKPVNYLYDFYNDSEICYFLDENGNMAGFLDTEKHPEKLDGTDISNCYFKCADGSNIIYVLYETDEAYNSIYTVFAYDPAKEEIELIKSFPAGYNVQYVDAFAGKLCITVTDKDWKPFECVFENEEGSTHYTETDFEYRDVISGAGNTIKAIPGNSLGMHGLYDCSITRAQEDGGCVIADIEGSCQRLLPDGVMVPVNGIENDFYNINFRDGDCLYLTTSEEGTDGQQIVKLNMNDGSREVLVEPKYGLNTLGFYEGKIYYSYDQVKEFNMYVTHVCTYDTASGKDTELYSAGTMPGVNISPADEGFTILPDGLYFANISGNELKWFKYTETGKAAPTEWVIDKIAALTYGKIEYRTAKYECPFCGITTGEYYRECFVLDKKYSDKADMINKQLKEIFDSDNKNDIDNENIPGEVDDSECEEHLDAPYMYCETDEDRVSDVHILAGHYIAIDMSGYWYGGGAHGYPERNELLFDLETGKKIEFKDIFKGSEQEFKEIAATATRKVYEEEPELFFAEDEDAVYTQAYESAGIEISYVEYGQDGITLIFYPYELGPFSSGFIEVPISYAELGYRLK